MSVATPMSPSSQGSATGVDATTLSRRELQYLARELELCRGNAKSDVIVEHVVAFMAVGDGAVRVASLLSDKPEEYKLRTPVTTPARRTRERPVVTPQAVDFEEDATESRRSVRKSPRTETSDVPAKEAPTPAALAVDSPIGRKMSFEDADQEESVREKDSPMEEATAASLTQKKNAKGVSKKEVATAEQKSPKKNVATAAKVEHKPTQAAITPPAKPTGSTTKTKSPSKSIALAEATSLTEFKANNKSPSKLVITPDLTETPSRRQAPVKNRRSPLANVSNLATKQTPKSAVSSLEALLASATDLVTVGSDRVKCTTTGHEMKADIDVISAYISGKRYQRAHLLLQKASFARFAPMFVDHPDEKQSHHVWCNVTHTSIARSVERIEAHMNGARYQKELPAWQTEQAEQAALAASKEAAQKEQEVQSTTLSRAVHAKNKDRKRRALGAKPDQRKMKLART